MSVRMVSILQRPGKPSSPNACFPKLWVLLADASIASGKTAVAKIPPDSIQPMDSFIDPGLAGGYRAIRNRIGNLTHGSKPRRRVGDWRCRPLQRRVEVDVLLVAGRQPESRAAIDIEHDMHRGGAGWPAGIERPVRAEPIEPGAIGDEWR